MREARKLLPVLLAAALLLAACSPQAPPPVEDDPVIIEPGLPPVDETGIEPGDTVTFTDKLDKTTVEDLSAAQAKISSYYFEQTIQYADSAVFLRVWYCADKMRVLTSVAGQLQTEFFYDYQTLTQIAYSPADSDTAVGMDFDPTGADAPDNPLDDDYGACELLGSEIVDRQLCYILQTENGDKLWVSTKYGFPLQVEFVDHLGDQYIVAYRNLEINTISEEQVAIPADLQVEYRRSGEQD